MRHLARKLQLLSHPAILLGVLSELLLFADSSYGCNIERDMHVCVIKNVERCFQSGPRKNLHWVAVDYKRIVQKIQFMCKLIFTL